MMQVACATDERYAPHCATMLQSLFAQHAGTSLTVHLLHGAGLSAPTLGRLRAFADARGARLEPVPVPDALIAGFPDRRFHVACWYRVLLPELLPQAGRMLYLDADLLVLDDLRPLWDLDLQGRLFAAAVNPLYPFQAGRARDLGLGGAREYLNSGVLLMDLARMRAAGLAARLREYGAAHPDHPWPEQDALSVVARGQWLPLHPRWNAQSTLFDLPPSRLPLTVGEVTEARARPAIVHFIGPLKPWTYLCRHPLRHHYAEFRAQTPWPRYELEGRTLANRLLRPLPLGWQLALRRRLSGPYRRALGWWRAQRLRGPRLMRAFARAYPEATFVQIGANDGAKHDPLRAALARARWRGVMVEPVPYVFERLARRYGGRAGIALERVAVASRDGTRPFHYVAEAAGQEALPDWYDEVGSFDRARVLSHADRIPGLAARLVTTEVPCVTFAQLCRRHAVEGLDLLHLDTEGHDWEILKTVDLERQRPVLLVYEHKHLSADDRAACRARLEGAGYACFEEGADTWCIDARARDARHRRLLHTWRRLA